MFDGWGGLQVVLLVIIGGLVAYWALSWAFIGYVERDMRRRGAPGWLGWAFVLSTPIGLIVWLVARRFFPVKDSSQSDKGDT